MSCGCASSGLQTTEGAVAGRPVVVTTVNGLCYGTMAAVSEGAPPQGKEAAAMAGSGEREHIEPVQDGASMPAGQRTQRSPSTTSSSTSGNGAVRVLPVWTLGAVVQPQGMVRRVRDDSGKTTASTASGQEGMDRDDTSQAPTVPSSRAFLVDVRAATALTVRGDVMYSCALDPHAADGADCNEGGNESTGGAEQEPRGEAVSGHGLSVVPGALYVAWAVDVLYSTGTYTDSVKIGSMDDVVIGKALLQQL